MASAARRDYVRYFDNAVPEKPAAECLAGYCWLTGLPAPRLVTEALVLWRELEDTGATIAATIPAWKVEFRKQGAPPEVFDPVAHSGVVMAVIALRARKTVPAAPFWALNWANFGVEAGQPQLGDVLCVTGERGAQVGVYVGEDDVAYHVIGATPADRVGISRFGKECLYAARRPPYQDAQLSARSVRLQRDGSLA